MCIDKMERLNSKHSAMQNTIAPRKNTRIEPSNELKARRANGKPTHLNFRERTTGTYLLYKYKFCAAAAPHDTTRFCVLLHYMVDHQQV